MKEKITNEILQNIRKFDFIVNDTEENTETEIDNLYLVVNKGESSLECYSMKTGRLNMPKFDELLNGQWSVIHINDGIRKKLQIPTYKNKFSKGQKVKQASDPNNIEMTVVQIIPHPAHDELVYNVQWFDKFEKPQEENFLESSLIEF